MVGSKGSGGLRVRGWWNLGVGSRSGRRSR